MMSEMPSGKTREIDPTTQLSILQALAHVNPQEREDALKVIEQVPQVTLSTADLEAVQERMIIKDQRRRFQDVCEITVAMFNETPGLVRGDKNQRQRDWEECVSSVENLWNSSAILWRNDLIAPATALAISTLEESGKLAVERFRLFDIWPRSVSEEAQQRGRRGRLLYRDHFTKHIMAAMAGALINVRVDRVLGIGFINRFLDQAEKRQLERLRQSCLYLDRASGPLRTPSRAISSDLSARYVALAGEVFAEIMPLPSQWARILEEVREFERASGLPDE